MTNKNIETGQLVAAILDMGSPIERDSLGMIIEKMAYYDSKEPEMRYFVEWFDSLKGNWTGGSYSKVNIETWKRIYEDKYSQYIRSQKEK